MTTTFGKYTLEKLLGKGGMGAVYLAKDNVGRKVALKVVTSGSKEMLERFQKEAQAVAKLKHPNIVQIYEAGVVNKQHYFAMEYVEGNSLEKIIEGIIKGKTTVSPKSIANIMFQVCSALDYAHKQKIIHRDIKPANIMIDKNGKAYVADFGLAKQLDGLDRSLTITGTTIGTPNYMSPEQAMGQKEGIGPGSDIFSVGATLYHCLTKQLPFRGKELLEVLTKVVNDDPPMPSSVAAGIPKDLETICLKCIEKDKAKRYQTATELMTDLRSYITGESISSRRTSYFTKLWRKIKKNKTASIAIAGAVLSGAIITTGLLISSANTSKKINEFYNQAEQLLEQGKIEDARTLYEKIIALSPTNKEASDMLSKCNVVIYEREQKTKQGNELRSKAKIILERTSTTQNLEDKIRIAEEALKVCPDFGEAYQALGYVYKDKKDFDKAHEYFTKAIEHAPSLAYSYYERAMITAYGYNRLDEAVSDFEMVVKEDPGSAIGYFAQGNIKFFQKKYAEAIKSYTEAINLKEDYSMAYTNRGAACVEGGGDLEQAISDLNEAIRLDSKNADAYNNRSVAYSRQGNLEQAIADCNAAIKLNPKCVKAHFNRGTVYVDKGDLEHGITDLNEAIKLNPKEAKAYNNRGLAYSRQGNLEQAIRDFNEAIRLDSKDPVTYNNRGAVYYCKGDLERAIIDYSEAIKLNPKYGGAYSNLGEAYYLKGNFEKAIEDCSKAIEINPNNPETYYYRSKAYSQTRNYKAAIADAEKFLKLSPSYNAPEAKDRTKEITESLKEWRQKYPK